MDMISCLYSSQQECTDTGANPREILQDIALVQYICGNDLEEGKNMRVMPYHLVNLSQCT